jgi:hypothetical protein
MSDKNYNWMPDAETLKRFYDGKLNADEHQAMTLLMEKDEFMRLAFADLNRKEFDLVENISLSVNDKLKDKFGRPPLYMNWKIWLSVFIGVIFITGFVAMKDWEGGKLVSENKGKKNKEKRIKNKDKEHPNGTVSNEMKLVSANETTMMFESKNTDTENKLAVLKKKDSIRTENKIIEEKKNTEDGPAENKIDNANKQKTDNSTTIDPGKKTYRLRIADAAVLTTENLAEKEASSGEDRGNVDVRNVNIGDPAKSKKNNSFNLEDMPQYKGGNEALAGYVKGKIAIKSYPLKESSVSTIVEFVVTSKGRIEDIKFQNTLDPTMEKDIKEVLSNVTFTPGKKSGKKGSMYYMMALMFE